MSQQHRKPEYLGEPTLAQVMRRPVWILALLLAMLVAAAFAWLGQWQMGSAIRSGAAPVVDTETPRSLVEVADASKGVTEEGGGAIVRLRGAFVAGDSRIVEPRENRGESGSWVVGHLVAASGAERGAHLAVAIGWAPDRTAAELALERLEADPSFEEERGVEGRYMPPEGPQIPDADDDPLAMRTMMPAYLANVWSGVDAPVYSGYLVMHEDGAGALLAEAGLDPIDSVAPLPPESVNWLNVFYAVEWVVFAGFALFMWYRLARDAWEKEHERMLLEAAEREEGPEPDISTGTKAGADPGLSDGDAPR